MWPLPPPAAPPSVFKDCPLILTVLHNSLLGSLAQNNLLPSPGALGLVASPWPHVPHAPPALIPGRRLAVLHVPVLNQLWLPGGSPWAGGGACATCSLSAQHPAPGAQGLGRGGRQTKSLPRPPPPCAPALCRGYSSFLCSYLRALACLLKKQKWKKK